MNFNFLRRKKKDVIKEEIFYNLELMVLAISVIMIWRGIWNLLDEYFLPEYFLLSNILTIVLGILFIFVLEYDLETLGVGDDDE